MSQPHEQELEASTWDLADWLTPLTGDIATFPSKYGGLMRVRTWPDCIRLEKARCAGFVVAD